MRFILKSRFYQISFVSISLLFVLWLSTSLWLDAFSQRQNARNIQSAAKQEKILSTLAHSIAIERQLFYRLFSTENTDPSAVRQLQSMAADSTSFASGKLTGFDVNDSPGQALVPATSPMSHESMGHGAVQGDVETMTRESPNVRTSEDDAGHHHHSEVPTATQANFGDIAKRLNADKSEIYAQLQVPRGDRDPAFGMYQFHEYSTTIESIDSVRRSLHVAPINSKREFYVHTKLKDVIWNFRESVLQISSLIEGVIALTGSSAEMAQTRHHADMLMELNIRVDLAWNELLKISNASENHSLRDHTVSTAAWYSENFKSLSSSLSASSRHNSVTLDELKGWLDASTELLRRADNIRDDTDSITLASVRAVERRASLNLALVSVLVMFALGMAIASVYFFRRADRQAHQDELTGLDNRRMFCINLNNYIAAANHAGSVIGMMMIDLDHFKYINDTMGHAAGDQLLKEVSLRIAEAAPESQSFARLGGDEFALLFTGFTSERLQTIAENVRNGLQKPIKIDGATLNVGSSIGISLFPRDASSHDSFIKTADLAMYCAKKSGTNQIVEYDSQLDLEMASTARLVNDLKAAIGQNQFELYYQPQFNLAQSKVVSVEALIRWNHPVRGFVLPNDFIPAAEENGLLPLIGDWVIGEACRQAAIWLYEDQMPLRVAVNISADHFFQPDFVQTIINCLESHKLPPQFLELEVTESVAVNDIKLVVDSLNKLREHSIKVALDDFGTGYSSLSYLQDLPLDTLKIDKSFIQKIVQGNVRHDSITETIVALGKSLQLETVAEGVETADQLSAVSDMHISVVQGYYYSKPVSASELRMVVQEIDIANGWKSAA